MRIVQRRGAVDADQHQVLWSSARTLAAEGVVQEGDEWRVSFSGASGSIGVMAVSVDEAASFGASLLGVVHFGLDLQLVALSSLSPVGSATVDVPVGRLPTGFEARRVHAQLGVLLPSGNSSSARRWP